MDVQKPEDLLHRLQQLQQDSLLQNERLAQATAAADSLRGGLPCYRSNITHVLPAFTADHSTNTSSWFDGSHCWLTAGQLQAAEARQQEHDAAIIAAHAAQQEADAAAARLERQLAVLGKERDGLKRILASYQQEDAREARAPHAQLLFSWIVRAILKLVMTVTNLHSSCLRSQDQLMSLLPV